MILSAIVAMDENRVMGNQNQLPWHLPADLQHFKKLTWGKPILMGRKTFLSIGHPLPGRENIVITRDKDFSAEGCLVTHSIPQALAIVSHHPEVMMIGGADLFKQTLPLVNRIYLTIIHAEFPGDVFFPEIDMNEWQVLEKADHKQDEKNKYDFSFLTLERIVKGK